MGGAIDGRLPFEPFGDVEQALLQGDPRRVAEDLARQRNIGETIAYIAHAIAPGYLRPDVLFAQRLRHELRDFEDGKVLSAADVEDALGRVRHLQRQPAGLRDIVYADEVAPLQAVLIDQRRLPIQKTRSEDGEHARV